MTRKLASALLCAWVVLYSAACRVDEPHVRCKSNDDCSGEQECYLDYCVLREGRDAATSGETRGTVTKSDAGAGRRRRATPTLTGRAADDDASPRVGMDATNECVPVPNDDDAGANEGTCCEEPAVCYDGPAATRGVGRCKPGMRACEDGKLSGECKGSVLPRPEACDNQGADDDCDGEQDNVRDRGMSCKLEGSLDACGAGIYACVDGKKGLQCVPEAPPPELCNAKDDDCDSKVDEQFDLQKDAMNCGTCGTRCSDMQACCSGACVPRGPGPDGCPECSMNKPCEGGRACCNGACVDFQTSAAHCGACGNACAARQTCCAGACVDTRVDEMNCGACGNACTQGALTTCCAGDCVDTMTDRRHCGECGNGCGAVCSCELNNGQPQCQGLFGVCP